jgi:lipoprotein-anchoring transpeptidase ErfK/SrfK
MLARGSLRWLSAAAAITGCEGSGSASPQIAVDKTRPTADERQPTVAEPVRPRPNETLAAAVVTPIALRSGPYPGAHIIARVPKRTRFHTPSVMAVIRQRGHWLGVASERLPNGNLGWVRRNQVTLLRELSRIDKGKRQTSFPVAVGAPATPTPPGRYGVTDRLSTGGAGSPYGCCVLALSGHQPDVPQDWPGGDRLAIHGTSAPETIGQAASHGCLRASEKTMRLLIAKVPLGTQVVIRR